MTIRQYVLDVCGLKTMFQVTDIVMLFKYDIKLLGIAVIGDQLRVISRIRARNPLGAEYIFLLLSHCF